MARRFLVALVGLVALAAAGSPQYSIADDAGRPAAGRGGGTTTEAARAVSARPVGSWPSAGRDAANSRNNPGERIISPKTVGSLAQRWSVTLGGTIAATPAVVAGTVYVADSKGSLRALRADTGALRWARPVSSYTGVPGDATRATPAVVGNRLYFGNRKAGSKGAQLVAASTRNGAKVWATVVDPSPLARITAAPTVSGGVAYLGVSSTDETSTACCRWRGSVVAVNTATGRVLWRRMTVPQGYTGGSVWSSSPAVDKARGLVYVTTGNNYSVPDGVCPGC
jgi:polyvinyl alcohol dehydrogenase (cytochrome)